jgi:hypothetical protein
MSIGRQPGLEVHGPHGRAWHLIKQPHAARPTAEQGYRSMTCPRTKGLYVLGQIGHESRCGPVRV